MTLVQRPVRGSSIRALDVEVTFFPKIQQVSANWIVLSSSRVSRVLEHLQLDSMRLGLLLMTYHCPMNLLMSKSLTYSTSGVVPVTLYKANPVIVERATAVKIVLSILI